MTTDGTAKLDSPSSLGLVFENGVESNSLVTCVRFDAFSGCPTLAVSRGANAKHDTFAENTARG